MSDQLSVGFLYPGLRASDGAVLHQAEDDFPLAEDLLETEVSLVVARTRVEEDAVLVLGVGLAYVWVKGDLNWNKEITGQDAARGSLADGLVAGRTESGS